MPIHIGRSCDFIEIITLYDKRKKRLGSTYPRRAKQLVLKGQAIWLDEGKTLQMIPRASSSAISREEKPMKDETAYITNDGKEIDESVFEEETDRLLLYKAKQNVEAKRILLKNVIAYPFAWIGAGMLHGAILTNMNHPRWWEASNIMSQLASLPYEYAHIASDAIWFLDWHFRSNYASPLWYVIVGVMLAWGGWIMYRAISLLIALVKRLRARKTKPDPVMLEYARLKDLES